MFGARVCDEPWFGGQPGSELAVGDGAEMGTDAPNVSGGVGVAAFWEFGCPKTVEDTGTKVGRWAERTQGWFGLESLTVSFSTGVQMTFLFETGESLDVETKTGAGTETARDRGT